MPEKNTQQENLEVNKQNTTQETATHQASFQPSKEFIQEMDRVKSAEVPNPSKSAQSIPESPNNNVYNDISSSKEEMHYGESASQMGINQTKKEYNYKGLIIKLIIAIVILVIIYFVLVFTNIIPSSKFKSITYTNKEGTKYHLLFYSKYVKRLSSTGNNQLVSKVSEGGKFPLALLISSGPLGNLDNNGIKDCSGSFPRAFYVKNNSLGQNLSVCAFHDPSDPNDSIYIVGFASNNQAHIITISQDYSAINLSSQSGAQKSLSMFGLSPYRDDIGQIIASIIVE